ncbi:hypothetical protein HNQ71_006756 [Mesorhizobium sangaii]|uniref:Uncharacterized protein n=1 Tax=Mesorhizobium sangaii TaxID=505389 RepID=A0A841PFS9_9HYPH|nr:hypothetical protein [Mesorhizobium sangaii]
MQSWVTRPCLSNAGAGLVALISDGCDPLDLRVTVDPHVEKQDTAAPGGYLRGFFSEA